MNAYQIKNSKGQIEAIKNSQGQTETTFFLSPEFAAIIAKYLSEQGKQLIKLGNHGTD